MDLEIISRPGVFPYRKGYQIAKRVMDVGLCLLAIPFVLPLMAIISILIYLDSPGPVIFTQERTGKGGRRFMMHKFRTMVPNAEGLKGQYALLNEEGELAGPLKLENDPRVTRVGRFLRKTSLDELPQLFNVLFGNMSLVGPRPTSWSLTSYDLWHTERLEVLPGITGLWQICGRGGTDFDEWVRWDAVYVERQSLWLDLQILVRTVLAVLSSKGAH